MYQNLTSNNHADCEIGILGCKIKSVQPTVLVGIVFLNAPGYLIMLCDVYRFSSLWLYRVEPDWVSYLRNIGFIHQVCRNPEVITVR